MDDEQIIESKQNAYKRALAQAKALSKKNGWTVDQALAVTWGQPRPARSGSLDELNTYAKSAAARAKASMYGVELPPMPPEVSRRASEINRKIEETIRDRALEQAMEEAKQRAKDEILADGFLFSNGGRPRADDLVGGREPAIGDINQRFDGDLEIYNGSAWVVVPNTTGTITTNGTLPGMPDKITLAEIEKAYNEIMRGGDASPPAMWISRLDDPPPTKSKPAPKLKPALEKPAPRAIRLEEDE